MNKSAMLVKISVLTGFLGVLALLFAWCAEYRGFVFGFESRHWYSDAMVLILIAIWMKLGAIYHKGEK